MRGASCVARATTVTLNDHRLRGTDTGQRLMGDGVQSVQCLRCWRLDLLATWTSVRSRRVVVVTCGCARTT